MKATLIIICLSLFTAFSFAQTKPLTSGTFDATKPVILAHASCGQCKLGLKAPGCSLAVRIKGKSYFVDGAAIDSFGDAHARDGFCNAIRKAKVQGAIVNNRFKATYIELVASH